MNFDSQKDPFEDLSPEFKDAVDGSTRDQIKTKITAVFRAEAENQRNKVEDLDVQEKKLQVEKLAAPYKRRRSAAKLSQKIAAKQGDDSAATDAAIEEAQVDSDESSDGDLDSAKEQYADAQAGYKEATKENQLKIKYALQALFAKGGVTKIVTVG